MERVAETSTLRLFSAAATDLGVYEGSVGPLLRYEPGLLTREIETAGLTGRGGAGFPAARKLRAVAAGDGVPVIIANGAEGEPDSAKDRVLLLIAPHLVLDGLQLTAECVGADEAYLYVGRKLLEMARTALRQRRAVGRDRVPVRVIEAPDQFVAGEESAVVAAVGGRAAVPYDKARPVWESGVKGRPTLVHNVETLAHIALIARYGAAWFRSVGTPEQPGTFLATVSGSVRNPGVYEVPYGIRMRELLDQAGGTTVRAQAVLLGGFHGTWIPASMLFLALSPTPLRAASATLGTGSLRVLGADRCGLVESARISAYLARQSAGQCGPCRNGMPALAVAMDRLARLDFQPEHLAQLRDLSRIVDGRGACRHPDGAVRSLRSALQVFGSEISHHAAGRCTERGM